MPNRVRDHMNPGNVELPKECRIVAYVYIIYCENSALVWANHAPAETCDNYREWNTDIYINQ